MGPPPLIFHFREMRSKYLTSHKPLGYVLRCPVGGITFENAILRECVA